LPPGGSIEFVITDFDAFADGTTNSRTTTIVERDSAARPVVEIEEFDSLLDGHIDRRVTRSFGYDAAGNLLASRLARDFLADGIIDLTETTTWTYDAAGRPLEKSLWTDSNGDGVPSGLLLTQFEYGEHGELAGERHTLDEGLVPDGRVDRRTQIDYTYDSLGRLLMEARIVEDSRFAFQLRTVRIERYDAAGNAVQTLSVDNCDGDEEPEGRR
jgi:hypothetical protein